MHLMVELHGQPGWVAALTPLSVDGMIVAASTTLLADSRAGGRGGFLPWALLVAGSAASLAVNVAVAEPTATGLALPEPDHPINDQDRDHKYEQPRDRVGRQSVIVPPAPQPDVGHIKDQQDASHQRNGGGGERAKPA